MKKNRKKKKRTKKKKKLMMMKMTIKTINQGQGQTLRRV
jgi:hypothetical protein